MNIKQYKSPNITVGRRGWKPDIIVCHITEGSYSGAVSWLTNPVSEASTHFVVSKNGDVAQLVNIADTAWGNGTTTNQSDSRYFGKSRLKEVVKRATSANYYTISVEHEGFYKDDKGRLTEKQLAATVELIRQIKADVKRSFNIDIPYDREHIVGHCDIAPQWKPNCPGQNFQFDEIIRRLQGEEKVLENTELKVKINGEPSTLPGFIKDGVSYVALRPLAETLGSKVDWDAVTKTVLIDKA